MASHRGLSPASRQQPDWQTELPSAKRQRTSYNGSVQSGRDRFDESHHGADTDDLELTDNWFSVGKGVSSKLFCDTLDYRNDIIPGNPVSRSEMKFLGNSTEESRKRQEEEFLRIKPDFGTKTDNFGDSRPLSLCYTHPVVASKAVLDTGFIKPLSTNHPLAAKYKETYDVEAVKKRELKETQQRENLFLRRPIIVQNDLYSKGDDIRVGHHAAEKNLPRKPADICTREELIERIKDTFTVAKRESGKEVDPADPDATVESSLPIVPSVVNWGNAYKQIHFDEKVTVKENYDAEREAHNPGVLWRQESSLPGKDVFGLMQSSSSTNGPENPHVLTRAYIWENQGVFEGEESAGHRPEYITLLWPEELDSRQEIGFTLVSNKILLHKMAAKMQTSAAAEQNVFQKKHIVWREPTKREEKTKDERYRQILPAFATAD